MVLCEKILLKSWLFFAAFGLTYFLFSDIIPQFRTCILFQKSTRRFSTFYTINDHAGEFAFHGFWASYVSVFVASHKCPKVLVSRMIIHKVSSSRQYIVVVRNSNILMCLWLGHLGTLYLAAEKTALFWPATEIGVVEVGRDRSNKRSRSGGCFVSAGRLNVGHCHLTE